MPESVIGQGIREALPHERGRLEMIEREADRMFDRLGIGPFPDDPSGPALERSAAVLVSGDPPDGFASIEVVGGAAHLAQLAVLPSAGRQGIGTALVTHVSTWAHSHGLGAVTLTTFRDVPWNGPFYAKLGFRPLATLPPDLAAIREHERAVGLDALGPRIAMVKFL